MTDIAKLAREAAAGIFDSHCIWAFTRDKEHWINALSTIIARHFSPALTALREENARLHQECRDRLVAELEAGNRAEAAGRVIRQAHDVLDAAKVFEDDGTHPQLVERIKLLRQRLATAEAN